MRDFTEKEFNIVSLFFESALWAVSWITFAFALRALLTGQPGSPKSSRRFWRPTVIVCLLLPLIATMDANLSLVRTIRLVGPNAPEFIATGSTIELLKFAVVECQTLLGDSMLLYRCWIVYVRSWPAIVFPGIAWLATAGFSVFSLYMATTTGVSTKSLIAATGLRPFVSSFWAASIAMNIICTVIIAWKIRSIDHAVERSMVNSYLQTGIAFTRRSKLREIVRIIVESGAIYTIIASG
ncbi:hypothetical protein HGRIS_013658 [Hohenbuehelia grisea]|uniref:Uncharacterized protein n=1 Tax=Hohenbuehelia grisea TaxID=104357 RepID=A0ABR3IW34_9AGAR